MRAGPLNSGTDTPHAPGVRDERLPSVTFCPIGPRNETVASLIRLEEFSGKTHEHPEAQIAMVFSKSSGTLSLEKSNTGRSTIQPMAPGCIAYFAPGESHLVQWTHSTELLNIYWPHETLRELADQSACRMPVQSSAVWVDPAMQALGQVLRDDFLWTGDLSPMLVDHARALLAVRMFRTFSAGAQRCASGVLSKQRLGRAIEAIHASPQKSFTLVELAGMCNASVFHFSRSFTARMGSTPFELQRQLRVQKAKALLRDTELSVEQISFAVGLRSATSFSRLFRRMTGQSPQGFRRSDLSANPQALTRNDLSLHRSVTDRQH